MLLSFIVADVEINVGLTPTPAPLWPLRALSSRLSIALSLVPLVGSLVLGPSDPAAPPPGRERSSVPQEG